MGVPTSEVGYTPAMPRREDHEVHKGRVVALGGGRLCAAIVIWDFRREVDEICPLLCHYATTRCLMTQKSADPIVQRIGHIYYIT